MKTLLTAMLCLAFLFAGAQITYVDLKPDYFMSNSGNKGFDLDADGTNDITFSFTILDPQSDVWFNINTQPATEVSIDSTQYDFIKRFENGAPINPAQKWKSGDNIAMAYLTSGSPEGPWPGATDRYMAFRIRKDMAWHYGWIRISVQSRVNNFTVKDYAFNTLKDAWINAGEQAPPVSVKEVAGTKEGYVFYITDHHLVVKTAVDNFKISMFDMLGLQVKSFIANSNEAAYDVSDLKAGIYFVSYSGSNGAFSGKVYVP